MTIGVPKEIKEQEYRVALLPSGVYQLAKRGHTVIVERGAGTGAGYPDAEYEVAGGILVDTHAEVFARADLIVKVKEPLPVELPLLRRGQILFTYLHLAASKPLTEALMKSGATCIAYETIEVNRRLPLLEPMSATINTVSMAKKTDMHTNRAIGRCCGISFKMTTSATIAQPKMRDRSMGWMRETDRL